jgi:hypothetical protein
LKLPRLVAAGLATEIVRALDGHQLFVVLGAVVLLAALVVGAGLWAANHTDITEWTPWQWKRGASATPRPQQPEAQAKRPSGRRHQARRPDDPARRGTSARSGPS